MMCKVHQAVDSGNRTTRPCPTSDDTAPPPYPVTDSDYPNTTDWLVMVKLLFGVFAAVFLVLGLMALGLSTAMVGGGAPTRPQRDIPPAAAGPSTSTAADSCPGFPWSVLAAIGKVVDRPRPLDRPGVRSGHLAVAGRPMTVGIGGKAGNTFAATRMTPTAAGQRLQPVDAIFTAANNLCRHGVRQGADVAGRSSPTTTAGLVRDQGPGRRSTYAAPGPAPGAPGPGGGRRGRPVRLQPARRPYQCGRHRRAGSSTDCSVDVAGATRRVGSPCRRTYRQQWYAGTRAERRRPAPGDLVLRYNTAVRRPPPRRHLHRRRQLIDPAPYTGRHRAPSPRSCAADFIGAVRPTAAPTRPARPRPRPPSPADRPPTPGHRG
jgi:hypothetical protein